MHHGVTSHSGSDEVCSPAIFETGFSNDKDVWIVAIDFYMDFYIIMLFLLTAITAL